jgi:four helix bundle protein
VVAAPLVLRKLRTFRGTIDLLEQIDAAFVLHRRTGMSIQSFRDLDAWKMSMDLTESVYRITRLLPADERFVLGAQLRRAGIGVPSNVSEGHQHGTRADRRYVVIAIGCLAACETQLELAKRLQLVPPRDIDAVLQQVIPVRRVLHALRRSLRKLLANANGRQAADD